MKKGKNRRSLEEFRKLIERISPFISFKGCESEEDIENKLKEYIKELKDRYKNTNPVFKKERAKLKRSIGRWKGLLKIVPFNLWYHSWINPHPIYKEILGMHDDIYDMHVEEKKRVDKNREQYKRWESISS